MATENGAESASDPTTQSQTKEGSQNTQISIDTSTIDICDSCNNSPNTDTKIVICRLCSDLYCNTCVDELQPSTFADIEKSNNLLWFCNDCIETITNKIRKLHLNDGKSVASVGCVTSDLRTIEALPHSPEDAESRDRLNPEVNVGTGQSQFVEATSRVNPEPDPLQSLMDGLKALQAEMCSIKESLAETKKPPQIVTSNISEDEDGTDNESLQARLNSLREQDSNEASQPTTGSTNIPGASRKETQQTSSRQYAEVTRDIRAPPPIIRVLPDDTPTAVVPLEGRQLVPRLMIPTEIMEERDQERRKQNIIVYNLLESNAELVDDRKRHDAMEVRCMLAGMQLSEIEVKVTVRLGKKNGDKPRPLLVTLSSLRDPVLRRARMVRRYKDWQRVFIDPDRTPKEQEDFKKLRDEFKRRKESGENVVMREGKILLTGRRRSYLDLDHLVTQAEEQRASSINLINLASEENLQQGDQSGESGNNGRTETPARDAADMETPQEDGNQESNTESQELATEPEVEVSSDPEH